MSGSFFKRPTNVPDTTVKGVLAEGKLKKEAAELRKKQFLSDTATIESNNGENTDHATMSQGMHSGEHAIGRYGLMPNTIEEMAGRLKKEDKMPAILEMLKNTGRNGQDLADDVENDQDLEQVIAGKLYDHLYKRFQGDEDKMNHAWMYGHNLSPDKITPDVLETSPRTEKFHLLREKMKKNAK